MLDERGVPALDHVGHLLEGTSDGLVEQIEELRAIGVEHLVLEFVARDAEHYDEQVEAFAQVVRPRLAR